METKLQIIRLLNGDFKKWFIIEKENGWIDIYVNESLRNHRGVLTEVKNIWRTGYNFRLMTTLQKLFYKNKKWSVVN